jgi:hypothetical protein
MLTYDSLPQGYYPKCTNFEIADCSSSDTGPCSVVELTPGFTCEQTFRKNGNMMLDVDI